MSIFKIDHTTRERTAERLQIEVNFRCNGLRPRFCNLARTLATNINSPPARTRMLPPDASRGGALIVRVAAVPPHANDTYHAFVPKRKALDVLHRAIGDWHHAV